jgi:hypothetical protein
MALGPVTDTIPIPPCAPDMFGGFFVFNVVFDGRTRTEWDPC